MLVSPLTSVRLCSSAGTITGQDAFGNVVAVNNIYADTYLGWYVKENLNRNSLHNFFRIPSTNDVLHSGLNATTVKIGDVNYLDVSSTQILEYWLVTLMAMAQRIFKADGSDWYYLP